MNNFADNLCRGLCFPIRFILHSFHYRGSRVEGRWFLRSFLPGPDLDFRDDIDKLGAMGW